ncbi:MAG: hypothetical protein ABGX12_03345 [Desulfurobacteriaceae bacterium]
MFLRIGDTIINLDRVSAITVKRENGETTLKLLTDGKEISLKLRDDNEYKELMEILETEFIYGELGKKSEDRENRLKRIKKTLLSYLAFFLFSFLMVSLIVGIFSVFKFLINLINY